MTKMFFAMSIEKFTAYWRCNSCFYFIKKIKSNIPNMTKKRKQDHSTNTKEAALSQFQTDPDLAAEILELVQSHVVEHDKKIFVEPAAGKGSFYNLLPPDRRVGVDIDEALKEECPDYIYSDFLKLTTTELGLGEKDKRDVIFIGNPPFSERGVKCIQRNEFGTSMGGSKNLALKFFNHAASMGDTVAYIVGCNFRKKSIQDKINPELHLVYERIINSEWDRKKRAKFKMSDTANNVSTVRTVFQIWQRKYDNCGNAVLRKSEFADVPIVKDGIWHNKNSEEADFKFVPSGDKSTNMMIRKWASKLRIGDVITDQKEIQEKLTNKTWFNMYSADPATVGNVLKNNL